MQAKTPREKNKYQNSTANAWLTAQTPQKIPSSTREIMLIPNQDLDGMGTTQRGRKWWNKGRKYLKMAAWLGQWQASQWRRKSVSRKPSERRNAWGFLRLFIKKPINPSFNLSKPWPNSRCLRVLKCGRGDFYLFICVWCLWRKYRVCFTKGDDVPRCSRQFFSSLVFPVIERNFDGFGWAENHPRDLLCPNYLQIAS